MFIDPHIDPEKPHYRDFIQLLVAAGNRPSQSPQPRIEIHRKILRGTGQLWKKPNMENTFRNKFARDLLQSNLKVQVFVWG